MKNPIFPILSDSFQIFSLKMEIVPLFKKKLIEITFFSLLMVEILVKELNSNIQGLIVKNQKSAQMLSFHKKHEGQWN